MSLHFTSRVSCVLIAFSPAMLASCSASDSPPGGAAGAKTTTTSTTTVDITGSGGSVLTGAGGGVGIEPGKGNAGSAGSTGVSADAACVAEPRQGEQRPVALHFMMDNSGSMTTVDPGQAASRWVLINDAVNQFVSGPANAGIWAGLDFFPEVLGGASDAGRGGGGGGGTNPSCNVADYQSANVPIDLLPGVNNAQSMAFTTAMGSRTLGGGTPTTPALQGAIAHAAAFQTMHPELSVAVVFTTDGQPNGCNSSVANAAAAAAAGLAGTPPIKTYVLGVGPEAANLDAIAMGGGTNAAFLVTMGGSAALAMALNSIRASTLTCDYNIPRRDGGTLDYNAVNVRVRVGSTGAWTDLLKVSNAAACGTGDGWFYDNPVPPGTPAPTKISLCPANCGPLTQTPGSQMDVLIGCVTRPRVVQ